MNDDYFKETIFRDSLGVVGVEIRRLAFDQKGTVCWPLVATGPTIFSVWLQVGASKTAANFHTCVRNLDA